jgi:ABC-type amino acid transport substrate-binding protein
LLKPLLVFIALFFVSSLQAKIIVGVTAWAGYTDYDETGVYFDLIREVYPQADIEFEFTTYKRMSQLFEKNKYDFVIGVAKDDLPHAYYANWHLDYDIPAKVFFNKSLHNLNHVSDLNGLTLSWLNGYDFDNYIIFPHKQYTVHDIDMGFRLLEKGRIDGFIDFDYNVPTAQKGKFGSLELIPKRALYLGFAQTEKGRMLAKQYDEAMTKLRASGKLKQIYGEDYGNAQFELFDETRQLVTIATDDPEILKVFGKTELGTQESKLYRLIIQKLTNYNVQFVKYDENASNSFSCYANKLYTVERAVSNDFSKPFMMYVNSHLFSKYPLPFTNSKSLHELVMKNPVTLGIPKGRNFDPGLMGDMAKLPASKIRQVSVSVTERFRQFDSGEVDLLVEFPVEVANYWHLISDKKLYSYELAAEKPYILGRLMCSKTEENKRFIDRVNVIVDELKQSKVFYQILRKSANVISDSKFDTYFKDAFVRP